MWSVNSVLSCTEVIKLSGHRLVTTSVNVARVFGKRHTNVLRNLKHLGCSREFTELNFEPSEYIDSSGRKLPMWEMTKDGFIFLVMGFTGVKAAEIKEAYISAFNQMANYIQQQKGLLHLLDRNEKAECASKAKASHGARLMLIRKKEKPILLKERQELEQQLQPRLFLN